MEVYKRDVIRQYQNEIKEWERKNVNEYGNYCGREDLALYGFIYARGAHIPINLRYSAMGMHKWAERAYNMARGGV